MARALMFIVFILCYFVYDFYAPPLEPNPGDATLCNITFRHFARVFQSLLLLIRTTNSAHPAVSSCWHQNRARCVTIRETHTRRTPCFVTQAANRADCARLTILWRGVYEPIVVRLTSVQIKTNVVFRIAGRTTPASGWGVLSWWNVLFTR